MSLHTSIPIVETEERFRTKHRKHDDEPRCLHTAVHFGADFGAQNVMTSPDGAKVQTPNELLKGTEAFRARKSPLSNFKIIFTIKNVSKNREV